jgi:hypothetical protein
LVFLYNFVREKDTSSKKGIKYGSKLEKFSLVVDQPHTIKKANVETTARGPESRHLSERGYGLAA